LPRFAAVSIAAVAAGRKNRASDRIAIVRGLRVSVLVLLVACMASACADSVTAPTVVQAIAPEKKSDARVSDVTAEAMPGVVMTQYDFDRITSRVKSEIARAVPGALAEIATTADPPRDGSNIKVKLVFTRYDGGNSFARFMLAGLGQIHIDADVIFLDGDTGEAIARYQVSKDFSFGGLYGGVTKIEDVEIGFAKSVAEILRDNKKT
jgi:Domain of unknown function (DUF4410)